VHVSGHAYRRVGRARVLHAGRLEVGVHEEEKVGLLFMGMGMSTSTRTSMTMTISMMYIIQLPGMSGASLNPYQ